MPLRAGGARLTLSRPSSISTLSGRYLIAVRRLIREGLWHDAASLHILKDLVRQPVPFGVGPHILIGAR